MDERSPDPMPDQPLVTVEVVEDRGRGPLAASATAGPAPAAPWREILAVVALVMLCDLTMYRGYGFAGYAALLLAAPAILMLGGRRARESPPTSPQPDSVARCMSATPRPVLAQWILGAMLLALAAKLVWCGSWPAVAAGFALVAAMAAAAAGLCPSVIDVAAYAVQAIPAGAVGLSHYGRSVEFRLAVSRFALLGVVLPVAAVAVFGTIFVLANPDLVTSFGENLRWFFTNLWDWIVDLTPAWDEVLLWAAAAWIGAGLLRPLMRRPLLAWRAPGPRSNAGLHGTRDASSPSPAGSPFYTAFRNTLLAVIALFAVYLVFEFRTLWFREFPPGFHYSGYAHEGAAWLTAALALSTAVLSAVFRGRVLDDPRLPRLKRLAWIWSAENMVLAAAVYNRLHIYVGFNGMTRMRTVGLLGISAVVAGFVLVVWKIARRRGFVWLLDRHLWAVTAAVYLYAVTPVDTLVHAYNVRRIMAGDPAPSVQISVHPNASEGVLVLAPLLDCGDEAIREGVRAMLAERAFEAAAAARKREEQGWTSYQLADRLLLEQLRDLRAKWDKYADPVKRAAALARFHEYAYQWY